MSTLERLYGYAKATGAGARENFTTEALAGAIRERPEPFLRLLRDAGLVPPGDVAEVALETQVVVPGTGVLDLVLSLVIDRVRRELWCEVKVNAGESGTQLDAYLTHLGAIEPAIRPVLFTLGPHALRDDPAIPFISWHRLRRQIGPTETVAWRDFADYLAEVQMSDDFDQPVAAREAAGLDDFQRLHGKVARVLALTGARAAERWPALPWLTNESSIRKKLFDRFASHNQLVLGVQSAKSVWLTFGAEPAAGEADLFVAVETWPSANDLQREILARADGAGLGPEWQRTLGAWGGLKRRERLVILGGPEQVVEWLMDSISTFDAASILPLLVEAPSEGRSLARQTRAE